jgi:hypothetical protein
LRWENPTDLRASSGGAESDARGKEADETETTAAKAALWRGREVRFALWEIFGGTFCFF